MLTRAEVVDNIRAYPPGSIDGRHMGCTCPSDENEFGKGWLGMGMERGWYVIASDCPLHWRWEDDDRKPASPRLA
jgi:hypothetical protein